MRVGFIYIFLSLLIPCKVLANEAPDKGIVHNTKETNALTYFCEKTRNDLLDCEFTQTRVQKKVKAEELTSQLDQARKLFQSSNEREGKEISQACTDMNEYILVLQGHKQGQNIIQQEKINSMSEMEKKDLINLLKISNAYCKSKTLENYLAMARAEFDRRMRTCGVSSNNWKQSFRLIIDEVSGAYTWVAKGEPIGACGVIQLSRFEPEIENSKLVAWNYISKKIVTNKRENLFPGMACEDLDENEYVFDWKSREHGLGCDYIDFLPF
ncbi:hypothetical protein [Nitrosomonas ureae]|uniref:Uncharacterized protein n=1 Tax=Nitrosomonas ureae TaxID=44577 RepID=A0A1H5RW41_9PROT|nr:hypothetical protein [Nitrosomonas ureae]SEF42553.1 hypothetical protein SAMN05216334_101274 [Nitrosomonas ureae]